MARRNKLQAIRKGRAKPAGRGRKLESVWVATAETGKVRFVAISPTRQNSLVMAPISLFFYSIRLKHLDALYKMGKRALLLLEHGRQAGK